MLVEFMGGRTPHNQLGVDHNPKQIYPVFLGTTLPLNILHINISVQNKFDISFCKLNLYFLKHCSETVEGLCKYQIYVFL